MKDSSFRWNDNMLFRKTKNKISKWQILMLLIIVLAAGGGRIYSWRWPEAALRIGGEDVKVLVANSPTHRFKGWSGRDGMGQYGGMLFIFPYRGQHAMVMREMRFPLDIVWVEGNQIVDIAPNVQTEPGRSEAELTPYFSRLPSTKVLELPAGFTREHGVKIGDEVEVDP